MGQDDGSDYSVYQSESEWEEWDEEWYEEEQQEGAHLACVGGRAVSGFSEECMNFASLPPDASTPDPTIFGSSACPAASGKVNPVSDRPSRWSVDQARSIKDTHRLLPEHAVAEPLGRTDRARLVRSSHDVRSERRGMRKGEELRGQQLRGP